VKRLQILEFFSGAISSYTLQSFMPKTGTKGFPFLSGLVSLFELMALSFNDPNSHLERVGGAFLRLLE
jgi:hypothetical protein